MKKNMFLLLIVFLQIACQQPQIDFSKAVDDHKLRLEEYFYWDELGGKKIKERYYTIQNTDKRVGPYESYYENGQLAVQTNYKKNKLDGSYKSYYENGQLMYEVEYKNGKSIGISKEY